AGVIDHHPPAPAGLARLLEGEAPQVPAGLPGAFAGRADLGYGAGLGPAAGLPGPAAGSGSPEPAEHRARLVVLLALLLVGQDVVGLGYLLEAILGVTVTLVGVRVVLASELAVR